MPIAGILKHYYPDCKIHFLIPKYAHDLVQCCVFVDQILIIEDCEKYAPEVRADTFGNFDICIHVSPNRKVARWAYNAGIKRRIGTSRRWFHFLFCNERIYLKRKNASIHESQLNIRLLQNLIPFTDYKTKELIPFFGFTRIQKIPNNISALLDPNKFKLIVHTLSLGNTRHWSLSKFKSLIEQIPQSKFQIILTGSKSEQKKLKEWIASLDARVLDLTGVLNLSELIGLISSCNGIVANTTGPMHIAAACGIHVLGLFPNYIPMHPNRWGPIGFQSDFVVAHTACKGCPSDDSCICMNSILPAQVMERILSWT